MRDKWYSDNRDIVKWSVLLLLARKNKADRIIQIAYYRKSEFDQVSIGSRRYPVPEQVLSHFRKIGNAAGVSNRPRITAFDKPFDDRDAYLGSIRELVRKFRKERCVICLDPDTGLEPSGGATPKHVKDDEAQEIWSWLPQGWTLVLYQHQTNRAGRPWVDVKRRQFARAIGVAFRRVGVASACGIANDVVLFFAQKHHRPKHTLPERRRSSARGR